MRNQYTITWIIKSVSKEPRNIWFSYRWADTSLLTQQITPSHSLLACRRFGRRNRIFCEGWRRIMRGAGYSGPLFNVFTRKYRLFYCTFIWLGNFVFPSKAFGLLCVLSNLRFQCEGNIIAEILKIVLDCSLFCLSLALFLLQEHSVCLSLILFWWIKKQ